jgi:hypothetical protein
MLRRKTKQSKTMTLSSLSPSRAHSRTRTYRLVDQYGCPHPILDDLYESLEAAWGDAVQWWSEERGSSGEAIAIGVEVSTGSGDWRTLRHPGA